MENWRILIAEDDEAVREGLKFALEQEGFQARACSGAAEAAEVLAEEAVDLCLLDVSLPDGSGWELCRLAGSGNIPVIFLTACDEEVNVVMGLEMGADDYVTKPFRIRELFSRIRTVMRRRGGGKDGSGRCGAGSGPWDWAADAGEGFRWGNLRISAGEARVYRIRDAGRGRRENEVRMAKPGGPGQSRPVKEASPVKPGSPEGKEAEGEQEVQLTAQEYRLLLVFAAHRGQILSRGQLLESIWDTAGDFVNDNTVSVYIKRLREKLEEDPQNPRLIQTVRGIGYRAGE